MDQEDPSALARLLGVAPDTDPVALKAAYEQAMNRATRAGDHRRALELSKAFDALPSRTRSSVYSGSRTFATVLPPDPWGDTRAPRRVRRRGSAPRPPRRRRRIAWKGVIGYGVVIPAVVLLAGLAIFRQNSSGPEDYVPPDDYSAVVDTPQPSSPQPSSPQQASTVAGAGRPLVIPDDAVTDARGLVSVVCRGGAGPTQRITAPPGATVSCPNGAVARLARP